jgi:alcohol-forming fatty acyl-CoA reductase
MTSFPKSRVAAFFDLDGTFIPTPSLESRFFAWLLQTRAIPASNYLAWFAQAVRLLPQGCLAMRHANKMYLRGISHEELIAPANSDHRAMSSPSFLPDALHRLTWHAHRRHTIFLITGTLEPLAREIAQAVVALLAIRGIPVCLGVRATRLRQRNGCWTGEVEGAPMFGPAKADTLRQLARELHVDLCSSYAYADSFADRHMLEVVGYPSAVNPSPRLRRLARRRQWPILHWPGALEPLSTFEPTAERCNSGLQFRPEASGQDEQNSTMETVV